MKSPFLVNVFIGKQSVGNPQCLSENLGPISNFGNNIGYGLTVPEFQNVGGFTITAGFVVDKDRIIRKLDIEDTQYRIEVPVYGTQKLYTRGSENHIMVGAIKGNTLVIYGFGLVIFRSQLFKVKHEKYKVPMFSDNNDLLIPDLQKYNGLTKFIKDYVEVSEMPNIREHKVGQEPQATPIVSQIEWIDPFSQMLCLKTERGNALAFLKGMRNIEVNGNLVVPAKGSKVKVHTYTQAKPESDTSFEWIAETYSVIQ